MFSYLSINFLAPLLIGGMLFIPFMSTTKNDASKPLKVSSLRDTGTSLMFAILLITIFTYLAGMLNLSIPITNVLLLIFLFIIVLVRIYFQKLYFLNSGLYIPLFAVMAGFLQYLPVFFQNSKNVNGLGMISKGNNDIASYAATASEFLKSGFINSQSFQGLDLNSFALAYSYQTPNSLLAFTSTALNQKPFQITIPVMIFAISFCVIAIAAFTQSVWPRITLKQALLVGWFVNSLAITTYIQSHYFLGQIIALGVSAMILESAFKVLADKVFVKKRVIEIGVIVALSIYSYPTILIPFLGIVYLILMLYLILSAPDQNVTKIKTLIIGTSLGVIVSLPYIKHAISLGIYQSGKIAGWRLFNLNPFNWMIGSVYSNTTMTSWASLLIWTFFLSLALATIGVVSRRVGGNPFVLMIIAVFIIVNLLFTVLRGNDFLAYSNWKLLSFFFPLLIAILSGAILYFDRTKFALYTFIVVAVILNPNTLWSNEFISTSSDDLELQTNAKVLSQQQLNIDLDPYFQTMQIASLLQDSRLNFKSLSYWPSSDVKSLCTLVNAQNIEYKYKFKINSTYSLASNDLSDCENVVRTITPGNTLKMESLNAILGVGWADIESWGVWSVNREPSLLFKVHESVSGNLVMNFSWQAFLAKSHPKIQVDVFVNRVKVDRVIFETSSANTNSTQDTSLQFPVKICKDNKSVCEVIFKIETPKSPASLGVSGDVRELGIGLSALSFGR